MTSPFPDERWGKIDGALAKGMLRFGSTKAGSRLIRALTPADRRLLTRTKGKYTILGPIGAPTLLLTTTGAKSGQPRVSPLLYCRDGDRLILVGSNFGQEHHPAWTGNLRKNPQATVSMGGKDIPVLATQLDGDERLRALDAMIAQVSTYAAYLKRTDREIRVFALTAI